MEENEKAQAGGWGGWGWGGPLGEGRPFSAFVVRVVRARVRACVRACVCVGGGGTIYMHQGAMEAQGRPKSRTCG